MRLRLHDLYGPMSSHRAIGLWAKQFSSVSMVQIATPCPTLFHPNKRSPDCIPQQISMHIMQIMHPFLESAPVGCFAMFSRKISNVDEISLSLHSLPYSAGLEWNIGLSTFQHNILSVEFASISIHATCLINCFLQYIYLYSLTVWRFYTSPLEIWIFYLQVWHYKPRKLGRLASCATSRAFTAFTPKPPDIGYVQLPSAPNTSMFWNKKMILKSLACASLSEKTENALASDFGCLGCLSWNTWQPREHSHAPPCLTSKRGVLHVNESMCLPQWWFSGRMPQSKAEAEAFLSIVFRTSAPIEQNLQLIQSFEEDPFFKKGLLLIWCLFTI